MFSSTAVCEGRRRLCDDTGRLLCGVHGVRADWPILVGLVGEENEAAAGAESCCMEVQSELVTLVGTMYLHILLQKTDSSEPDTL